MSLSLQSERAIREALKESLEKEIHCLLEELQADRAHRQELTGLLQEEAGAREALQERVHHDVWRLGERLEVISEMQNEKARDFNEQLLQASYKTGQDFQDITRQMLQVRGFSENWQTQMEMRLKTIEAGSVVLENNVTDAANRQGAQFDWLRNRLEKLYFIFDEARIEERVGERIKGSPRSAEVDTA